MTEMVTSGSMSGAEKRSDGLLGESASERTSLALGAAGPVRHRASPRLYLTKALALRTDSNARATPVSGRPVVQSGPRAGRPMVTTASSLRTEGPAKPYIA